MPASNYHIGDYTVKTTGNLDLSGRGKMMSIQANGSESSMMLTGKKAVGIFSGPTMAVFHNDSDLAGKVTMGVGETGTIKLVAGPPEGGVTIKLSGPETLELSVGMPGVGSKIMMGPESIMLRVADVVLSLTPEAIIETVGEVSRNVTAEGHSFAAGETAASIGLQGFTAVFPTRSNEIEAGTTTNAAIVEEVVDGAVSAEATITSDE